MWNPIYVKIINLFSHEDTKYVFKNNVVTLFYGINEDDEGSNSNGAGKSTIMESVVLAIGGEVERKADRQDFIMDGKDFCEVELMLKSSLSKSTLRINRKFFRSKSKSSVVSIYENGVLNTSELNKDEYILQLLGIVKEDLTDFFIIGQDNHSSFFSSSDTDQKEIISRLAGFDRLKKLLKHLGDKISASEDLLEKTQNDLSKTEELLSFYNTELQEELTTWDLQQSELKKQYKLGIIENNSKLKEIIIQTKQLEKERVTLDTQLNEAKNNKLKLKNTLKVVSTLEQQLNKFKSDLAEANAMLKDVEADLNHKIQCPNCEHVFVLNSELSVEELSDNKKLVQQLIAQLSEEKKFVLDRIVAFNPLQQQIDDNDELIDVLSSKITLLTIQIANKNASSAAIQREVDRLAGKLNELLEIKENPKLNRIKDQIEKETFSKQLYSDGIVNYQNEIDRLQFWKHHFGNKGFMTFLANKCLGVIEAMTNSYLAKLKTNLSVKINGFTKLKSGEVREKIEIFIFKDGIYGGKFGRYSGGEKRRINVSGILAINKLINLSSKSGGLNFLGVDENFDGLDVTGQNEVLSLLSNCNQTILIISHNDTQYDNAVFIRRRDKISKIIQS